MLPSIENGFPEGFSLEEAVRKFRERCIDLALAQARGNKAEASRILGIKRGRLCYGSKSARTMRSLKKASAA